MPSKPLTPLSPQIFLPASVISAIAMHGDGQVFRLRKMRTFRMRVLTTVLISNLRKSKTGVFFPRSSIHFQFCIIPKHPVLKDYCLRARTIFYLLNQQSIMQPVNQGNA